MSTSTGATRLFAAFPRAAAGGLGQTFLKDDLAPAKPDYRRSLSMRVLNERTGNQKQATLKGRRPEWRSNGLRWAYAAILVNRW
jgi:hypothetical protein